MSLTIIFTRYAEPNWLVRDTIDGLARQREVEADIFFLDQTDDVQMREICGAASTQNLRFNYVVIPMKGLSFARNRGIERSTNDIILYIDSDAIADPCWAYRMQETLLREGVGVAGSKIIPKWHKRPLLVARSEMVLGSYSMLDLGDDELASDRLFGAGFGIHRGRLGPEAYFDEKLGRHPGGLLGGEEIDLCARTRAIGLEVVYNGRAIVEHQVRRERISYRWLMRRFYYSGVERALTSGTLKPRRRDHKFIDYLAYAVTLPATLLGYWHGRRGAGATNASHGKDANTPDR